MNSTYFNGETFEGRLDTSSCPPPEEIEKILKETLREKKSKCDSNTDSVVTIDEIKEQVPVRDVVSSDQVAGYSGTYSDMWQDGSEE